VNNLGKSGSADRRGLFDRRARPTTFLSVLRFDGRRQHFRRSGEEYKAYVDCPSRRTVVLLFIVLGASVLDALFTLLFIQNGGGEANPLMATAILRGDTHFVGLKMALTGMGAWLLAAHQGFPLAFRGLHALAAGYGGLLLIHAVILLS
jgi:Domain of unknown function (DUF5658)